MSGERLTIPLFPEKQDLLIWCPDITCSSVCNNSEKMNRWTSRMELFSGRRRALYNGVMSVLSTLIEAETSLISKEQDR